MLDLSVLDTRSYRDDQPCGDVTGSPCAEVDNPNAQVLGPAQEAWLLTRLGATDATWKVLGNQVPLMRRNWSATGLSLSMDKWDAYPAARARLLRGLHDRGVNNVAVLTGDVHNAWAGTVHLDPGNIDSPAIASEFVATSISSDGDGSETLPSTARVLARNPHIAFFNNRRGYTLHEATDKAMTATYRAVDYVSRPGAPRVDKGVFVAEAGDARVKKA
jgi:alkaline phosphatase D